MIKTAIENGQNLVIEGGYIPFNWKEDFDNEYLKEIRYYCLVMSETYINNNFNQIKEYAHNFEMCKKYGCNYILIDEAYCVDIEL